MYLCVVDAPWLVLLLLLQVDDKKDKTLFTGSLTRAATHLRL
jgi:hypothetical protein